MEYAAASAWLKAQFHQHNFSEHLAGGKIHAVLLPVEPCVSGAEILVSFPGYKARNLNGRITYDYRVDFRKAGITTALSHANLIVDLFNKCHVGKMNPAALRNALLTAATEGPFDYEQIANSLPYRQVLPSADLLEQTQNAHGKKTHNAVGNGFDLSVEELFKSIKWIVIQEDINYPISRGKQGRKMAFSRYLEAVFVSEKGREERLGEVLRRALAHTIPEPWPELKTDYSSLQGIR